MTQNLSVLSPIVSAFGDENRNLQAGAILNILNGQTLTTDAADMRRYRPAGLVIPAGFSASTVTFKVSTDGTNFYDLYDSTGSLVSVTVGAGRYVALSPATFLGTRYVKVVAGSAVSADTSVTLVGEI